MSTDPDLDRDGGDDGDYYDPERVVLAAESGELVSWLRVSLDRQVLAMDPTPGLGVGEAAGWLWRIAEQVQAEGEPADGADPHIGYEWVPVDDDETHTDLRELVARAVALGLVPAGAHLLWDQDEQDVYRVAVHLPDGCLIAGAAHELMRIDGAELAGPAAALAVLGEVARTATGLHDRWSGGQW